jgi:hypothetical protein
MNRILILYWSIFLVIWQTSLLYDCQAQTALNSADSSQQDSVHSPRVAIYVHPFDLYRGSLRFSVERSLRSNLSVRVFGAYAQSPESFLYAIKHYLSLGFEGQLRYYPKGIPLKGLYVGAYGYYRYIRTGIEGNVYKGGFTYETLPFTQGSANAIGLGAVFGMQYYLHQRVPVDAYLGFGLKRSYFRGRARHYINEKTDLKDNDWDNYTNGVRLNMGFGLGYLLY